MNDGRSDPLAATGLVRALAVQAQHSLGWCCDLEELVSLGTAGLFDAAARFDPGAGAGFETYAYYRIRGTMFDEVRRMARVPEARNVDVPEEVAPLDEQVALARQRCRVAHAVAELPERERTLILAHYYAERQLGEAGAELGMSKWATCRLHTNALERLREKLGEP
jgi:RNA polymerase sigma factor (sigma-70 family)